MKKEVSCIDQQFIQSQDGELTNPPFRLSHGRTVINFKPSEDPIDDERYFQTGSDCKLRLVDTNTLASFQDDQRPALIQSGCFLCNKCHGSFTVISK